MPPHYGRMDTRIQTTVATSAEERARALQPLIDAHGAPSAIFASGDALVVRAAYVAATAVERPVFHIAIVDVDTGVVVTSAS